MKLTDYCSSWILLLVLVGVCCQTRVKGTNDEQNVKEKYISAVIYSKWSETPFLQEASEFIFRNNPSSFWPFVDSVSQQTTTNLFADGNVNNKTYYDQVVQLAARFVSPLQLDLLKLTLSIRTYSPTIEMSRRLAEEALKAGNVISQCATFVNVHGKCTCDVDKIQSLIDTADLEHKPFAYQFDKHYNVQSSSPSKQVSDRVSIILYAPIGSKEFKRFHDTIVGLVKANSQLDYILRHNYIPVEKKSNEEGVNNQVGLSGYGVELDIKSTEYKATDDSKVETSTTSGGDSVSGQSNVNKNSEKDIQGFMFDRLKELHPDLRERLDEYRKHLQESTHELAPLKAWQMQDLSLQAAQRIMESPSNEALSLLEDLSQNFPVLARALSAVNMKAETKKTLKMHRTALESRHSLEPGQGALFVNGLEVNIDTVDIFTLNSLLTRESRLIDGMHRIGMTLDHIKDLTYLDTSSKSNDYGVDIRDSSIQWLNDLESDKKYKHWPRACQDILRPTYPGMMRSIAKNFFNLVLFVDPAKRESRELLKTAESFYVNDVPIRIGFVFVTSSKEEVNGAEDASVALYRAHNYVKEKSGGSAAKALSFLTDIYAKVATDKSADVRPEDVISHFKKRFPKEKNLDDVFGAESYYDEGRKLTMDYYNKVGLRTLPQVLVNGFPLGESEIEADVFEESVLTKIMQLTQEIQMSVYRGMLTDSMNLVDWLMSKDNIMPRLNPLVLSQDRQYVDLMDDEQRVQFVTNLKYISSVKEPFHPLTVWVVADPDTEQGRQLLNDAIYFYDSSKESIRVALIIQKASNDDDDDDLVKKAITYAFENLNSMQAFTFIKRLLKEKTHSELKSGKRQLADVDFKDLNLNDVDYVNKIKEFKIDSVIKEHQSFLHALTPFKSNQHRGLIVNGWILGPFDPTETFLDSDFSLLENFISKIGLKQIKELINKWQSAGTLPPPGQSLDDKLLRVCATIGKYSSNEKRVKLPELPAGVVKVSPRNPNSPHFDIALVIDPLTRQAQHISTILRVLHQTTNVHVQIYFNCKDKLSAAPLKSFYRYVLESDVRHDESTGGLIRPYAYFHNMPQSPIFTMNIHAPESWMVEASNSPYDLDNIRLNEIESEGAYGEYELEHLIIEGHAFDVLSGQPPRGLQFILGTPAQPEIYDTIVMANLGYFQLKASPGIWMLQLREGRSKDIYEIVSHENTDSESKRSQNVMIVIDSFESKVIKIKVSKKADKISENLLDDKDSEKDTQGGGGIWNSINNLVGGGGGGASGASDESGEKKENVLNIFSLASGHMYERLLRIMMLTVLKNTQARVKFWFLKNYLSPQFTKFLPYYASEYNFDYELVQYKWPRWLHHESEKQRIIWGYKILFLDVLFPLSVDKIIYVDADQIVKADMTELRDLDLKGAPYGYVPFCDSRKEMDGYRFWKSGYWQMHLGNRKYHISALYVVDLKKFRKIAAGDRLRGQYQGLSQDPNSLSNLDQDLPNNMIHQVNIFSLPQEWLYCDTWCSSDTLSKAKTIDLCNNPQTKEPKLNAAQRIFPQWKDFDNEVRTLYQKWQSAEQKNQSSVIPPIQTTTSTTTTTTTTASSSSSSSTTETKEEL